MPETTCCPDCGAELPTGATDGLCPRCLLGAGLGSDAKQHSPADSPFAATTPQAGGFVPPTPASLAECFPDLEILEFIGQGGMGAVYKARQTKLDRLVALKVIRPESADDPAFAERFTREARTLARLGHSNIVSIHDFGEIDRSHLAPRDVPHDGVSGIEGENEKAHHAERDDHGGRTLFYFVMEFVDGANLRQLMESGELQPAQSLAIVPQICDALQYAHDEGIVHRDIKPENILIDRRGRVKIADFGLAKLAGQSADNFTLTGTHQVMGTPRYMAPEQMGGSKLVDHRADIYSLGVVLYEMLTGELPMGRFEAPSIKVAIDSRLDDVVHRALATEPDSRYQRASEIRTDMESIAMDALSSGELESIVGDGSIASGLPGPSTIMERQVAGVVNWFKGEKSPAAGPKLPQISASNRAAIQQQVRRPAIALMLTGAIVSLLSFPPLRHASRMLTQTDSESLWSAAEACLAFALLIAIAALIIRGGWHLLTLDRYRPAVLAGLLGQPLGIWALTHLSRKEVRSAFTTDESRRRDPLAMLFLNTTLWGVLIAAGGILAVFLPWAMIYNSAQDTPDAWYSATGFAWSHGMVACLTLTLVILFLLATTAVRPVPVWRPMLVAVGGVVVLFCCGSFIDALNNGTLAVQPLLDAASWGVELPGGGKPRIIADSDFVVNRLDESNLLITVGIGLLIIAAVDFRLALQPPPARRRHLADVPHFSRKAIVGACWAPLFFLAIAALTVSSDAMIRHESAPNEPQQAYFAVLLIPAGVVTIAGVLAPFATTILGMLAISDIRRMPSQIRGLGLAFVDAIFFPLLIFNVALLFGLGLALQMTGISGTTWVTLFLLIPLFLALDLVIGICGWQYVSRSVRTDAPAVARQPDAYGGGGSKVDQTSSAMQVTGQGTNTSASTPVSLNQSESSTTSVELRRIEMQLKAPAAGLMVVAFLNLAFWSAMGFSLAYEGWNMQHGRYTGTPAEVFGAIAVAVAVLSVVGTIIQGTRHMRRLTGIGWCYAATILVLIPWAATSIVGFFIGIWVLNVLSRPEVKEAFVQRSLEREQNR